MSSNGNADTPKVRIPANCGACPIRHITVCRAFTPDRLHAAATLKTGDRILRAGATLVRQGDVPRELFHLVDGWFAVRQDTLEGDRVFLDVLLPGAFVWYLSQEAENLPVTIEALSTSSVCVYDVRDFSKALQRDPALAIELANHLSEQRNRMVHRVHQLQAGQARTRVIAFLLDIWMRAKEHMPHLVHNNRITIPLKQSDFADALSMTPVYVNRHLRSLKDEGLIDYSHRVFHFRDVDRLHAEMENHREIKALREI